MLLNISSWGASPYLQRFQYYQYAIEHLSRSPDPTFLTFISNEKPLSRKLRERWLYFLAQYNDWEAFVTYYQDSSDLSLQCYYEFGRYQQGEKKQAIEASKKLWSTGNSLPPACDKLFTFLITTHDLTSDDLQQRIKLALTQRNDKLALYLLKKLTVSQSFSKDFEAIQVRPTTIQTLKASPFFTHFYLYGAKTLLVRHIEETEQLWKKARSFLNDKDQQSLLKQIILLKAAKNRADAPSWLSKIKPQYLDTPLLEWKIRFALKDRHWGEALHHIEQLPTKNEPCWQYWKARALEAQHHLDQATLIYTKLAQERHYYGFLATTRLHQPIRLHQEPAPNNWGLLQSYAPILNQIKAQYAQKKIQNASVLLNDFSSELSKNEKSALSYWVLKELRWTAKSVALSNDPLLIDQIALRFPLIYQKEIHEQSHRYGIPEALIYAIIRQESGYREEVISSAGAHGLMQLMPSTAHWISKLHHIPYYNKQQLFTFSKNIHLGVAYLHHLAQHYQNRFALVITAYNAGPTQVKSWLERQALTDLDIWVETVPFTETRNYLKNVMTYTLIYQNELKQPMSFSLFLSSSH